MEAYEVDIPKQAIIHSFDIEASTTELNTPELSPRQICTGEVTFRKLDVSKSSTKL